MKISRVIFIYSNEVVQYNMLLTKIANSLDPDQDWHFVGPDLNLN